MPCFMPLYFSNLVSKAAISASISERMVAIRVCSATVGGMGILKFKTCFWVIIGTPVDEVSEIICCCPEFDMR